MTETKNTTGDRMANAMHWGRRASVAGCLGLAALGAQAQADYSTYGVLDFSYGRFEPSGVQREYRFNSNSLTATFGGVKFSYGLENGWTPGLTLEAFYRLQDGQGGRNDDDPLLSRNAFVSLAHREYGTLRAGRLQTSLFNLTARFNALGNSVAFSPAVRHVFAAGNLIGVQRDFYWNQAVSYTTPSLDGVTATLMLARGERQDPGDQVGLSVLVSRGLLAFSGSVQHVHVDDGIQDPTNETAWQLSASYNFGLAQVFAMYTGTNDQGLDVRSDIVSAGVSAPLGPGTLSVQMAYSQADGPAVDRRQTTTSAAYLYAYDSLTDLYVVAMDDRASGQTRGQSVAAGVRWRF
jgi:predicted porin